ncbi:MAG: MerR family transcriptional regulator [Pseudomonadota bacterium]
MAYVQEKSAQAFRTISEVAEVLDTPAHVLRFWESKFTQIKPVKRGGGRRYYRPQDIDLLRGIRDLLYGEGLTIKGVQKVLRERGVRHVIGLGAGELSLSSGTDHTTPEAPAEPAPTPRTAAPANAPTVPEVDPNQMSLFDAPADPVAAAPAPAAEPAPARQAELAKLYAALTDLRDRMKAATT